MKLKSIKILNYRSVEEVIIEIDSLDDRSFTYGLIGINEAGKSSILKSLALLDEHTGIKPEAHDFYDKTKPIEIIYLYNQSKEEIAENKSILLEKLPELKTKIENRELEEVELKGGFLITDLQNKKSIIFSKLSSDQKELIENTLADTVYANSHYTIYWKSEDKYLISSQISLASFSEDPSNVSIPLKNCFTLIGLDTKEKIKEKIIQISNDSTERELLREDLGKKVTNLIKKVWPNHPVVITFDISGDSINFHIKDPNGKPRTTNQRSDGFKQFVSFLLNISSQKENNELSDSLILLDEPETHLHPQAQEYFLAELIKLTQSENNICFFATHSNYMVDKNILSRNFRVVKVEKDGKTMIERLNKKISTYASVNYEVFNISSTDYFNELYSCLHQKYIDEAINEGEEKERSFIKNFDKDYLLPKSKKKNKWKHLNKKGEEIEENISIYSYLRHLIHHPERREANKLFSLDKDLSVCIEEMIKIKEDEK